MNPPENAFDDHYEPILLIMNGGATPAKDACFQCYQPPVFYWISAVIAKLALSGGMSGPHTAKLLQFFCCIYGIAAVWVCYLILRKFAFSAFSTVIAFATICFLPRHIYMSAMTSNDTISYFAIAISIYLTIVALERRLAPSRLVLLSLVLTLTVFTKYTAFAILPAVLAAVAWAYWVRLVTSQKQLWLSLLAVLALPCAILTGYMMHNVTRYHAPLPSNVALYDPSIHRPRDAGGINFVSFAPWQDVAMPMLAPGKLHSFWTMIYSGMWFDTEPYFLYFLDANGDWWRNYNAWYRGQGTFPGKNPSLSRLTSFSAAGLILLGLIPLALLLVGCFLCLSGKWKSALTATPAQRAALFLFPVLLIANLAGVIGLTLQLPVYNSIKPSYLLNSTPAFVIFIALGVMFIENNKLLRRTVLCAFGALSVLAATHILHIVFCLQAVLAQGTSN